MDDQLQPGRLSGLRCPQPQCRHAEVWVVSTRDWERCRRILLYCRNGHLLVWQADPEGQPEPVVAQGA